VATSTFGGIKLFLTLKNVKSMSLPIRYAFNSANLSTLVNKPACEKVVFSLCNAVLKKPGEAPEIYMYAFAEGFNADGDPIDPGEPGCPTPPGWGSGDFPEVDRSQLGISPSFAISKAKLAEILEKNEIEQGNPIEKELHVELRGENSPTGMEAGLFVLCLFKNGNQKEESFKTTPGVFRRTAARVANKQPSIV
jgi:hypothetical protein